MANGEQQGIAFQEQSLTTNQQGLTTNQQGLMTEEETVEQPKTLYETLRGVDPIQLRNQILKNRAQNQIASRLDSSDVASIMSQVNAGKLTLDQAVAHSKTMQSGTMKKLNELDFDENTTSKVIDAYYKTHGSTMTSSEMNVLRQIRNRKLRQEVAKRKGQTVQDKRNLKNTTFHTFAQDRYLDLAHSVDLGLKNMTDKSYKDVKPFHDALTAEVQKDMGKGGNILSGSYDALRKNLFGISMRIPTENIKSEKGFMVWDSEGTPEFVPIPKEDDSPTAIRMLWFKTHLRLIQRARSELGKMNTETLPEEQSQQADPLNLFQYVE